MDVYGIFGHGCDVIRETNAETDKEMPPGCTYVTIVLCGLYSHYLVKLMYAFQDPFIKEALKNPIENLEKLNYYFTLHHQDTVAEPIIHVHKAGTAAHTYVDSLNTFLYDTEANVFKSGLYKLGDFKTLDAFKEDGDLSFTQSIRVPRGGSLTPADIEKIYNGSLIQPRYITDSEGPFASVEAFSRANEKHLTHYLSDLFVLRPGIYYNFACRPSCLEGFQSKAERRRERSREDQFTAEYYGRLGHNMQPILPSTEIVRHIDPGMIQTIRDWYNVRARMTNEFIMNRLRAAMRSSVRDSRLKNIRNSRATRSLARRGLSKTKKSRIAPKSRGSRSRPSKVDRSRSRA